MAYGHLRADCLYTGISSAGPTLGIEYGKPLPLPLTPPHLPAPDPGDSTEGHHTQRQTFDGSKVKVNMTFVMYSDL